MKTMSDYALYCTEEQTRKALALGASVEILDTEVSIEDRITCISYHDGFMSHIPKITDYLYDDEGNRITEHILIEDTEEHGDMVVYAPTAEQMISWLEDGKIKKVRIDSLSYIDHEEWLYAIFDMKNNNISYNRNYDSRKAATLAAIDAALEYLTNNK